MYKIKYSHLAVKDLKNNHYYIKNYMNNSNYLKKYIRTLQREERIIKLFPYSNPEYTSNKSFKNNYRISSIGRINILYTINETNKEILIWRVLYEGSNIEQVLI